ncbi:MAG TPA: hypothetical protein VMT46_16235 [Anaerolineaceae bacterium]|nr:hypothetical protein [Anaerolineaceae bacterium]
MGGEIDPRGEVVARWEWEPERLHCVFRYEMEHLLARVGFTHRMVTGDFFFEEMANDSPEMAWVARV